MSKQLFRWLLIFWLLPCKPLLPIPLHRHFARLCYRKRYPSQIVVSHCGNIGKLSLPEGWQLQQQKNNRMLGDNWKLRVMSSHLWAVQKSTQAKPYMGISKKNHWNIRGHGNSHKGAIINYHQGVSLISGKVSVGILWPPLSEGVWILWPPPLPTSKFI